MQGTLTVYVVLKSGSPRYLHKALEVTQYWAPRLCKRCEIAGRYLMSRLKGMGSQWAWKLL